MRNYNIKPDLSEAERQKIQIIRNTYLNQRTNINYDFNNMLIAKYCNFDSGRNDTFWNLFNKLDDFTDLSDPDTSLPNSLHALQTAEAIRQVGTYPDWFILCGLIHDMGKILFMNGCDEDGTSKTTQWAVVGDTFATGIPIPDSAIIPEFNIYNQDHCNIITKSGITRYENGCGLDALSISFGHDEYMYRLLLANNHKMPREAEYIIRYHSLYVWHQDNAYSQYENDDDIKMKSVVREFNKFDLYTKDDANKLEWTPELREYYSNLVKKYISSDMIIKY